MGGKVKPRCFMLNTVLKLKKKKTTKPWNWFFIVALPFLLCLKSVFSQLRLSPGLRKVLFATALGTVALALAAHQLKRRRRRKKQIAPDKCGFKPGGITVPILPTRRVSSVKKGWPRKKGKIPKEVVQREMGRWGGESKAVCVVL